MPKMDFFSGQPDDAKAAQEDSSASSPQWDDAFAGMQKLDLFEEPAAAGGAAQLTGNVPSAVPGAVQQPTAAAAVPAPQEESKANQTGRAIFENLFSAEEEEEDVIMPPPAAAPVQEEPAIPDVILPGMVQAQPAAPTAPVIQPQPVAAPAAQPAAPVQPQMMAAQPVPSVTPVQEMPVQVQPQPAPAAPAAQPQTASAPEHTPAADAASVPVFAQEEAQTTETEPETESMFPKEEPRRVSKAKPINWHVNILEEKEKEAAARAAAQAAAAQAVLERTTSSIPPVATATPAQDVEPIRSSKPPVQTVIQGEKPAWMPLLETAMTEKGLTPPVYDETATTKVFTPAPKKSQQPVQPAPEPAAPAPAAKPEPAAAPAAPITPAAPAPAVNEQPPVQPEKPAVSSVTTEIPLLSDFDDLPPVGQVHSDPMEGFGALFSEDVSPAPAQPVSEPTPVKKDPDKMKDFASGIAATFGDGIGEDLTNDPANLFSSDPTETVERPPVSANQSTDDFYADDLQDDPFANDSVQREKDYPGASNEGNRKMLIFVGLAAALLVILIAAYFIFFSGDSTPASTSSSPASGALSSSGTATSVPATSTPVSQSLPTSSSAAPVEAIPRDEWYMQLVNRQNVLEESFAPPELTTVGGVQVDSRIADPLQQMLDAASSAGINLKLTAGYRSYAKQKAAYNNGNGTSDCPPGASEHNLGLSADIQTSSASNYDAAAFEATPAFTWLKENAATYGFILRYPKDKESVTGFTYEPWHYRYVGTDQAQKINASGLCFEEYLQQNA